MADRKQTSLPIIGIDTSSPDHNVKDGKCSVLHNLRYTAGAWRNVHPFAQKHSLTYKAQGVTYYAWRQYNDSSKIVYSLKDRSNIRRGDLLYAQNESGAMVFVGYVQRAGLLISKTDTKPIDNIYAWQTVNSEKYYYTLSETVSKGDKLYSDKKGQQISGEITNVVRNFTAGTVYLQATVDINGEQTAVQLTRYRNGDWNTSESLSGYVYEALPDTWNYTTSNIASEIVYHHPVDADNRYIAVTDDAWTETYYGWQSDDGIVRYYSLVEPLAIKIGDALYDHPDLEFDPDYFRQESIVWAVRDNGSISCRKEVYSLTLFYAWASTENAKYYTRAEIPQVGDEVFAFTTDNEYLNSTGTVKAIGEDMATISVLIGENEVALTRNEDGDALLYYYTTELQTLSYTGVTHTITKTGERFCVVEIGKSTTEVVQILQEREGLHKYTINHFGSVLIISDTTDKKMYYYMKSGDKYAPMDYSEITLRAEMIKPNTFIDGKLYSTTHRSRGLKSLQIDKMVDDSRYYAEPVCQYKGSEIYYIDHEDLFWRGEMAYFCAIRGKAGEILTTTPIQIINSQEFGDGKRADIEKFTRFRSMTDSKYDGKTWYIQIGRNMYSGPDTPNNIMCRPDIRISYNIPTDEIRKNAHDVAIYATRVYPNVDYEKLSIGEVAITSGADFTDGRVLQQDIYNYLRENNLPEQPFYLAKAIKLDEFNDGEYILRADYSIFDNIEHNILYEPSSTEYSYFGERVFEYNNRLHLCGIKQTFPKPKKDAFAYDSQYTNRRAVLVKYKYDNGVYYTGLNADISFAEEQPALLTYPSSYGEAMYFVNNNVLTSGNYPILAEYKLKQVASLDIAYCINYSTSGNLRYTNNTIPFQAKDSLAADTSGCPAISNRIQVSESNNCFILPFENSYRIGTQTNRIIAINSAAIEMSDAKFGEFPLYVFTEEGVFAMQSGTDTLYSAIVPIAYDKAISPNTLAVNYNVLFVTARGLMALSSRGLDCLSAELNTVDNLIPDFLRTASLVRLPKYNEVMVFNADDPVAYIYSLDNKVWSSRDISNGSLLNNNEMVVDKSRIIDITAETDSADALMSYEIDTRCVKFGTMELKRVETLAVRFESVSAQCISVEIYGSVNLNSWTLVRSATVETNKDIIIRRVPMSAKYLRFRIYGATTEDIKILPLDIEYYFRMLHRMR